jgi:hypothetical protein
LNKHNNSGKKSEPTSKRTKSPGPVRRDTKEVLAELVAKLKEKLDSKKVAATSGEEDERGELRPNLDRLTVGVERVRRSDGGSGAGAGGFLATAGQHSSQLIMGGRWVENNYVITAKAKKNMVGTTGLEPATSTVSI